MRTRAQMRWLAMATLALVLAGILLFLYARTREHDPASYFENVALLRQLKQLDSRWELDVLKSRMGINANYDSLVDPLSELNQLRGETAGCGRDPAACGWARTDRWPRCIPAGDPAEDPAWSSISNPRIRCCATRWCSCRMKAGRMRDAEASRTVGAGTSKVLLDTLVYSQGPSDEVAAQVRADVHALQMAAARLSPSTIGALDIFSAHVLTVLREQPVVNGLLESIAAVPWLPASMPVDSLLSDEQRENGRRAEQFQRYLLVFSIALVALLLYAALSLIRSHAVINRVNRNCREPIRRWNSGCWSAPASCARRRTNWSPLRGVRAWPRLPATCSTTSATCSTASTYQRVS